MPLLLPPLLIVAFVQTHVALDVEVLYTPARLTGTATLTLANRGQHPESSVPLLLNRLMQITSARGAGGEALVFTSDVVIFEDDPMRQALAARVQLPSPVAPGERATIAIDFEGALVGYTETGMLYVKDRIDPAFTILRTDALAFPSVGVPSMNANRAMPLEPFGFAARVTVPSTHVVATGGELRRRSERGEKAAYEYDGAAVPFLNILLAPYTVVERAGLRIYALPGDEEKAASVATATERALAALERWYGALRSRPSITIMEIPQGFGSQASLTGGIMLDASAFANREELPHLYHELSHLWNAPDRETPSARWNEGLATYLQYRLASELDSFEGSADAVERTRRRVCAAVQQGDRVAAVPFARYGTERITDWSYRVGYLLFAALERRIGRERLDGGLRSYMQRHGMNGGTMRDLARTIDEATPEDLRAFFEEWFFSTAWTTSICGAGRGF
jgi:hypothetical protein